MALLSAVINASLSLKNEFLLLSKMTPKANGVMTGIVIHFASFSIFCKKVQKFRSNTIEALQLGMFN